MNPVEEARLLNSSKDELIGQIKKLKKDLKEAVDLLEPVLYCQRLTELDNHKLRRKINLNANLFEKLIRSKMIRQMPVFEREKMLTHEEVLKRNGGLTKPLEFPEDKND